MEMATAKTLLFIRHAETALAGTFCGSSNPDLNERGRAQAAALEHKLRSQPIDRMFSSDLARAQETAAYIAAPRKLEVTVHPALREIDFGDWEARTFVQIARQYPVFATRWMAEFPDLTIPNAEPVPAFRQRVLAEIQALRAVPAEHVVVLTHAGVLCVLLEEFGHLSKQQAYQRTRRYTCSVMCSQRDPAGLLEVHL